MLQTLTGNIWTHKTVVDYSQLLSIGPNVTLNENITTNSGGGNYHISTPTPINLTGMTAVCISGGSHVGETAVVSAYTPNTSVIAFSPDFSPTLDTTCVIQFQQWHSYSDIFLFGIPANHIIVGTKITTLTSFNAGTEVSSGQPNRVFVVIGESNLFPVPINGGDLICTSIHSTYGISNLTVPVGTDNTYEYGSFRWFTTSAPGTATYARNALPPGTVGSPLTTGSYCAPTRLEARDIIARFCILDWEDNSDQLSQNVLKLESEWNFNSNVTAGTVEIAVQYMAI